MEARTRLSSRPTSADHDKGSSQGTRRRRTCLSGSALCALVLVLTACNHKQSSPAKAERYSFTGRIVTIDAQDQSADIDGDKIPGYMDAMTMSYKIKPPSALNQLAPGDSISAELVQTQPDEDEHAEPINYWLENVKVTGHKDTAPALGPNSMHTPALGEEVPDFAFTNQSGERISLHQYRGKVLLVTFIYTRCPFPDFCPRMSNNFAQIYKALTTDPSLDSTHLLTISFDPEHDTPKVLRDYAFSVAHTHDPALFNRWEFAVVSAADLPKVTDFFALTVKPEGGLITHNLSTTVIGPDGKVVNWYHGGDWQVLDLITDLRTRSPAGPHKL